MDNLKLLGAGKTDVGFSMADAAYDAAQGVDKFKDGKINARTLLVLYPNKMHVVTVEGTGVSKLADLKGKRVSTGSAGSGTEIMAMRLLEAIGIDPRGHPAGAARRCGDVNAMKRQEDRAFFWVGGVPTAAVTDLAATPGTRVELIDHAEAVEGMDKKSGPLYVASTIPANSYPGQDKAATNVDVWNIIVASDKMSDEMAYQIVKTLYEKKPELVAVHKEAENIDLKHQGATSPLPYHPGARSSSRRGASSSDVGCASVAVGQGCHLSENAVAPRHGAWMP